MSMLGTLEVLFEWGQLEEEDMISNNYFTNALLYNNNLHKWQFYCKTDALYIIIIYTSGSFTVKLCYLQHEGMGDTEVFYQVISMNPLNVLSGVGVTKPIFSVPLFSHFFWMIKTVVTCMISSSYLAGVTAAVLRRHLANMNMIEIIWLILLLNQNLP